MRDDRDDPFGDIFDEIERMMNEMAGAGDTTREAGRDVHVSTYHGDGTVRVVADLPGVDENAIDLKCDGQTLTLAVTDDGRRSEQRVSLPVRVDEHSADASFNNGVLQVEFDAAADSADIDL